MSRIIISTTGASVFNFILRSNDDVLKKKYDDFKKGNLTDKDLLLKLAADNLSKFPAKASSEINSLEKLGLHKDDKLFFFATDTHEGKLAAEIIERYFKSQNYFCKVDSDSLKVDNNEIFEKKGIKDFIDKVIDIIESNRYTETILNPTGGFRSIMPYLTIIGMIYKKKMIYLYEIGNELIHLPLVPLDFAFDFIKDNIERLRVLSSKGIMNADDFYKGCDYNDREEFDSFIIKEDDLVMISALGEIFYKKYEKLHLRSFVMTHESLFKKYQGFDESQRNKADEMLEIILDPERREFKKHSAIEKSDLLIYKSSHTAERIFYYIENNIPYICEIYFKHDDYEKKLDKGIYKKDFDIFQFNYKIEIKR